MGELPLMAINGRINVDVLFHDTDGTTSLKVVSLEGSTEYTTGKVAIVTGTVGTAQSSIGIPMGYRDAAGNLSTLDAPSRVAFSATGGTLVKLVDANELSLLSRGGSVSVSDMVPADDGLTVSVEGTAGTASYTLVLYGT
jgi:hypothetical protein